MAADAPIPAARRPSAAKIRLLEVADELFYADGINTTGIDRIIAEASVTKATFYKQYGSKDALILEYVVGRDRQVRESLTQLSDEDAESREDAPLADRRHHRRYGPARVPRLPLPQRRGGVPESTATRSAARSASIGIGSPPTSRITSRRWAIPHPARRPTSSICSETEP